MRGAEELAAFFLRIRRENALAQSQLRFELCWFNGQPGLLVYQNGDLQVALSAVVEGERHSAALRLAESGEVTLVSAVETLSAGV